MSGTSSTRVCASPPVSRSSITVRRAEARARAAAIREGRREWYHTVQRGEALASIAKTFSTTPDSLRKWNNIEGNRIRIGEKLLVKPFTKEPMKFPEGVVPERK